MLLRYPTSFSRSMSRRALAASVGWSASNCTATLSKRSGSDLSTGRVGSARRLIDHAFDVRKNLAQRLPRRGIFLMRVGQLGMQLGEPLAQ